MVFWLCGNVSALDNAAWLGHARKLAEGHAAIDSGETPEDGIYCIAIAEVAPTGKGTAETRIEEAVLEAKRSLTAYVHGETMSASRELTKVSGTRMLDEQKHRASASAMKRKISTKVDALVRGMKFIGQISVGGKDYVACVTTENMADEASILRAAQEKYGEAGVVASIGEAPRREVALQKALRGAVEQVLGTLVVGYDKMSSEKDFQKKVFSGTDGVVETYRVTAEREIALGVRVEIVAKVSQRNLLDNYTNYMKFLGDPAFYIESSSADLASRFSDFFTEMGIRITNDPYQSRFVIHCTGTYHEVTHPANGRVGTQLSLRFRVQANNGSEVLIDMKNDPRKSTSFLSNAERRIEVCAEKAFAQMQQPLHGKIQAMVGKLVSRQMEAAQAED